MAIIAGASVVSVPSISGSLSLGVSLGGGLRVRLGITLLAFSLFSRGNYGKSIAVKATVGMRETINTCVIDMSGWVSVSDSGHGVGDSWCANSVSVGNSVVTGIGETIAITGCVTVRVDYLRGSQGRAGGQDGGVSSGITFASVVSSVSSVSVRVSTVSTIVSATISAISVSAMAIVSAVPSGSFSLRVGLRVGLRLGQSQTGQ
jgi:hypothetical protein